VEPFDNIRLAYLRSKLARARLEKTTLAREILSPMDSTAVDVDFRIIQGELEDFIAAAKLALAAKKSPTYSVCEMAVHVVSLNVVEFVAVKALRINRNP
jgi:hypothetical protein